MPTNHEDRSCPKYGYDLSGLAACAGPEYRNASEHESPRFNVHGICACLVLLVVAALLGKLNRSGDLSDASILALVCPWIPVIVLLAMGFGIAIAGLIRGDSGNRITCLFAFVGFGTIKFILITTWT